MSIGREDVLGNCHDVERERVFTTGVSALRSRCQITRSGDQQSGLVSQSTNIHKQQHLVWTFDQDIGTTPRPTRSRSTSSNLAVWGLILVHIEYP